MGIKSKIKSVSLAIVISVIVCEKCIAQNIFDKSKIETSMIKALEWQETHPIIQLAPTDWTNGAYYTGVARAHKATRNQMYMAALKNQAYRNNWQTFNRAYHADDVAISYSYLYIDTKDNSRKFANLEPTKNFLDTHLYMPNQWTDGSGEKSDMNETILWWWCDALFMAPPVINLYAKLTNQPQYLEQMHKYYMETYNQLYDKEEHLFARDMRFVWKGTDKDKKEKNGKKIFWSRGNGWVIGGIALMLDDMSKDYEHRGFYENLYKEMAAKLLQVQPKSGLWHSSLLCPETFNHGEVSGSGFNIFALAWGINNGLLTKSIYLLAVKKAWKALAECQHDNGMVGWVQNIGGQPDPASYNSWQNYGTGAFLLAGSEVMKLQK